MTPIDSGPGEDRTDQDVGAEPFVGYADADVPTVKKHIDNTPEGDAREELKRAIRAAEEAREQPRRGVLELTEPAAAAVPPDEPEPEDTSGRPSLIDVAEERVANRNERVITTRQED